MSQARILFALIVFAFVSIVLVVTGDHDGGGIGKRSHPNVTSVYENDPELSAARTMAKASIGGFIERLPDLRADGARTSVKFPLTERGEIEQVWMNDPVFDGDRFTGSLASIPLNHPSWSHGDRVSTPLDQVIDWAAITDDTLYGGFSIYVLRDRMTPEARRFQDQELGFVPPNNPTVWH